LTKKAFKNPETPKIRFQMCRSSFLDPKLGTLDKRLLTFPVVTASLSPSLKDSREELERAKNDLAQTRPPEGTDSKSKAASERQEQQRESIDKAIERNEKAQDKREEERKRKQEEKERGREDRDSFERDSWGRY
jgi:hypothetical protein